MEVGGVGMVIERRGERAGGKAEMEAEGVGMLFERKMEKAMESWGCDWEEGVGGKGVGAGGKAEMEAEGVGIVFERRVEKARGAGAAIGRRGTGAGGTAETGVEVAGREETVGEEGGVEVEKRVQNGAGREGEGVVVGTTGIEMGEVLKGGICVRYLWQISEYHNFRSTLLEVPSAESCLGLAPCVRSGGDAAGWTCTRVRTDSLRKGIRMQIDWTPLS